MTLAPAYGRDYKSQEAVRTAFFENKDFQAMDLFSTGMTSMKELKQMGKSYVNIRYDKLRKSVRIEF
jgi:hypothetical protein